MGPQLGRIKTFNDHLAPLLRNRAAQSANEYNEMRMSQAQAGEQERQAFADIIRQYGVNDPAAVSEAAAAAGLGQQAVTWSDRAGQSEDQERTRALENFKLQDEVATDAMNVIDQESYSRWLNKATEVARITGGQIPGNVPKTYDEQYFSGIRERAKKAKMIAQEQFKRLGADEVKAAGYQPGTVVEQDLYSGKQSVQQAPPTTWGEMSGELPEGVVTQRSNTGKVATVYRPPASASGTPRDKQLVEAMLADGVVSDAAQAWDKVYSSKSTPDPLEWAGKQARDEVGDTSSPGELEARTQFWLEFAERARGQASGPQKAPPVNDRKVGTVYSTPRGPLRWLGNGQWESAQ